MTTYEPPADLGVAPARVHRLPAPRAPSEESLRSELRWCGDDAVVVEVTGEIDSCTATRLAGVLSEQLRSRPAVLRVDLGAVGFLGTAGLRVLEQARRTAEADGVHLIVDPSGSRAAGRALELLARIDDAHPPS